MSEFDWYVFLNLKPISGLYNFLFFWHLYGLVFYLCMIDLLEFVLPNFFSFWHLYCLVFLSRLYWSSNHIIWEKAFSILAGNLNQSRNYVITAVLGHFLSSFFFALLLLVCNKNSGKKAIMYKKRKLFGPGTSQDPRDKRPLGSSIKDVGIFLAFFDTPLPHVGILTLLISCNIWILDPPSPLKYSDVFYGWPPKTRD